MRRKLLVLPVLVAGMIGLSHGQPPAGFGPPGGFGGGGFGGKGGGPGGGGMRFGGQPPDPETIWGYMSKGQPSINLNDPANARTKDRMIQQGQAIPADGMLTKEAFKANFQASMQKMAAGGGQPGGAPMQFQMGGPGGGGPGGFGGGRGGFDPSAMTDDQLRGMMQRMDTDGDGRISAAEATQSGRFNPEQFAQYDTNKDGFLDTAEYRVYLTARFQQRQQEQGQQPMPGMGMPGGPVPPFQPPQVPGQPPATSGQPGTEEPTRPEVWRYGKLPKGAPSWFLAPSTSNPNGLDADRDGQVGLYEWRRAGKKTSEFVQMDLNGDGYLTYAEYKGYIEKVTEQQKADDPDAPAPVIVITPGGSPGGGDRSGPKGDRPRGEGKGPKGDRNKGQGNPWQNSNKGGK